MKKKERNKFSPNDFLFVNDDGAKRRLANRIKNAKFFLFKDNHVVAFTDTDIGKWSLIRIAVALEPDNCQIYSREQMV